MAATTRHSSVYHVYHVHWGCGFQRFNASVTGPEQVRDSWGQQDDSDKTADPCRTRLELTQMRTLHCNRGPWGNLGGTLSASLLLCSIWKSSATCSGRPSRPSSASFSFSGLFVYVSLPISVNVTPPLRRYVAAKYGSSPPRLCSSDPFVSSLKPLRPKTTNEWSTTRLCPAT